MKPNSSSLRCIPARQERMSFSHPLSAEYLFLLPFFPTDYSRHAVRSRMNSRDLHSKLIPASPFVVDGFKVISCSCSEVQRKKYVFVLTHFHADHYTGLDDGWNHGKIYCTPVTAKLVALRLKVRADFLVPLPIGETAHIDGWTLRFADANHCPGAAQAVFVQSEQAAAGEGKSTSQAISHDTLRDGRKGYPQQ